MKRSIPADRLRNALVARNWTIADLAREADVAPDTITRALDPDSGPLRLHTESKILSALGRHPVDEDAAAGLRELTGDGAAA